MPPSQSKRQALVPDRIIGDPNGRHLAFVDALPEGYVRCEHDVGLRCDSEGPFLYSTTAGWEIVCHEDEPDVQKVIAGELAYERGLSIYHPPREARDAA